MRKYSSNNFKVLDEDSDDDKKMPSEPIVDDKKIQSTQENVKNTSDSYTRTIPSENQNNDFINPYKYKRGHKPPVKDIMRPPVKDVMRPPVKDVMRPPRGNRLCQVEIDENDNKPSVVESVIVGVLDRDLFLNTMLDKPYRFYTLHVRDKWDDRENFNNIFTVEKWMDVGILFNTLLGNISNINKFNYSIMFDNISPLWEDISNRLGSKVTIQIYDVSEALMVMKKLFLNIINKTLLRDDVRRKTQINGITFYPKISEGKTPYYIIQIWFNNDIGKFKNYFSNYVTDIIKGKGYSVKFKSHKPEF